ncbi:VTT domain-containing protein [Halomonas campisalis]|uniref:TVP38/TMEM64 family membrane protein n=1 Tax=Billgrantia campisalis TaxID=74661 RepID=A0ABS9PEJ5_9GAMM|nr:VTT domain-containing protein [Halomonas campisalis]MCG6659662.1 VTT domain-containing protein [Halomonas campisalis]MDR5864618.1 VTT domain-containing protein [Halomonas campisalis]
MHQDTSLRWRWRWVAIGASVLMAGYLWMWHSPDLSAIRHWAEEASHHPATVIGVILIMAVTLAFGLPGSIGLWLIAPFYPPHVATPMLILGSVGGALGAYYLAARVGDRWSPKGLTRKIMRMLEKRSDFLTQCALRVLPGFPHSVINYAAGLRRLPLRTFVIAAVIGLGIKWAVYASAIHGALEAVEKDDALTPEVVLPLLALTLLLLIGAWVRRRVEQGREV